MKPLPLVSLNESGMTPEEIAAHWFLWDHGHSALINYIWNQRWDRRDAALMFWMTRFGDRHYHPDLPAACWRPVAHLWVMLDPEWPAGHHIMDLT